MQGSTQIYILTEQQNWWRIFKPWPISYWAIMKNSCLNPISWIFGTYFIPNYPSLPFLCITTNKPFCIFGSVFVWIVRKMFVWSCPILLWPKILLLIISWPTMKIARLSILIVWCCPLTMDFSNYVVSNLNNFEGMRMIICGFFSWNHNFFFFYTEILTCNGLTCVFLHSFHSRKNDPAYQLF